MCILCVIQKWSRRVATMLPWLVLPLIGLWALSQLLPPAFRFEITSPRLACVFVLLVTLFWYEVLMPQLSTWRVQRNARLRERKRLEAMELQKLKKTATRRCRNCSTPYRDQNPGGGRFMCSYCGHISKRPVLDMSVPPGLGLSGSGILKDLVGRSGKMLNGKGWNENGWMHGQEWSENSTWISESTYWPNNSGSTFGDDNCLGDKSYSGGVVFACQLFTSFFMSIRWLWRKIFSFRSSVDESSTDADQRRLLARQGENGTSYHESRVEKAHRKVEEKRQARLEKERLEEEERKQREEVARLVEERRKLRDEKIEAEKCSKSSPSAKEKDTKKEAEKKRQERKKERDKASSKSNSDAEELDKRIGKETEHKRELDKNDYLEHHRHASDNFRGLNMERRHGHSVDNNAISNNNTTGAGSRYFDRVKGTFLSSSKAFTDSRFFGRGVNMSASIAKENKPIGSACHSHASAHTRHINPPEFVTGKSGANGGERNTNRPVVSEPQPSGEPKKSWQQLFACSPSVPTSSNVNVISRPSTKPKVVQNSQVPNQDHSIRTFDNPISFGLPSPFTMPAYSSGSTTGSLGFSSARDIVLPQPGEKSRAFMPEEEHFEDPCYVPDPISLLGPVSESLDLRAEFETGVGLENPHLLKNIPFCEVSKPSPIESPLSRLRVADKKQINDGSWQMWKTTFGQDLLLPSDNTRSNEENAVHHVPHNNKTASLFAKDDPLHSAYPHRKDCFENDQRSGPFSPIAGPSNHDPWSQKMFLPTSSGTESLLSISRPEEACPNNVPYMSPTGLAPENPFELPSPNHWLKEVKKTGDGTGRQFVDGQFLNQDVQSFW